MKKPALFILLLIFHTLGLSQTQINSYLIDLGRFKVPVTNRGEIGNSYQGIYNSIPGKYDEGTVIFSAGLLMTGYRNNHLWFNAIMPSMLFQDYRPGQPGSEPSDPSNSVYTIKSTDPSFGKSWKNYKKAVEIGASFYDGNKDGKYNPIDLNGNGRWDLNEDCPDILGDITTWCVYNDGVPSHLRRCYWNIPEGIEIHQTAFGYLNKDVLFVRYRIIYRNDNPMKLDSVIFSLWADFDIGDAYYNDLVGCDTTLALGYCYKSTIDNLFGHNPPAVGVTLLQGPPIYIIGETFIDVNGNSIFDDSIDTAIDTAIQKNGSLLSTILIPGARNQNMTSFNSLINPLYPQLDPSADPIINNQTFRCLQEGLFQDCTSMNVCDTTRFGKVFGNIDCNLVNPYYHFSGDPVNKIGWVNTFNKDYRIILNTGKFILHKDKPIDIWAAYVVGRWFNSLNSITKMKITTKNAIAYFDLLPIVVPVDSGPENVPEYFSLYQNYPNPFNSMTKIKYDIPQVGSRSSLFISLKVYDLLGNEIAVLVNEEKSPGSYEVIFDAGILASGIYIYQIKTQGYMRYRKMILMK